MTPEALSARRVTTALLLCHAWLRLRLADARIFVGRFIALDHLGNIVIAHAREVESPHYSEETRLKMAASTGVAGAQYADMGTLIIPLALVTSAMADPYANDSLRKRREHEAERAAKAEAKTKAERSRSTPVGVPPVTPWIGVR